MFSQVFGDPDDASNEGLCEPLVMTLNLGLTHRVAANIISAVEFNGDGSCLACGDHGGNITIYKRPEGHSNVSFLLAAFSIVSITNYAGILSR